MLSANILCMSNINTNLDEVHKTIFFHKPGVCKFRQAESDISSSRRRYIHRPKTPQLLRSLQNPGLTYVIPWIKVTQNLHTCNLTFVPEPRGFMRRWVKLPLFQIRVCILCMIPLDSTNIRWIHSPQYLTFNVDGDELRNSGPSSSCQKVMHVFKRNCTYSRYSHVYNCTMKS